MNPPEELLKRISSAKSPSDYNRALKLAYSDLDERTQHHINSNNVTLACKNGCSLCCHLRVEAKAHEILLIGEHVESTFSSERKASLRKRLTQHKEKVKDLAYLEHMSRNVICPLLENGSCSVYEVRPFGCRRHQSKSLARCQYSYENPADLESPGGHDAGLSKVSVEAEGYLQDAYAMLKFDNVSYELGTALLEIFENKKVYNRWRNGKKAFVQAKTAAA